MVLGDNHSLRIILGCLEFNLDNDWLNQIIQINLGFPHDLRNSDLAKQGIYCNTLPLLDYHRKTPMRSYKWEISITLSLTDNNRSWTVGVDENQLSKLNPDNDKMGFAVKKKKRSKNQTKNTKTEIGAIP